MIFNAFLKALGQIYAREFRGVLLRSLGLTVLILAAFAYATSRLLRWLLPDSFTLPWIGELTFLDELGSGIGVGTGLILSIFLMIPVASVFIGLYLESIAAAVEAKHFPSLPKVKGAPITDALRDSLRFMGLFVIVNLFALILYLVFAPLAPIIFWLVNGLLLGREYFQLVALRRLGLKEANALRKRHFLSIWAAGVLMAILLTVPILSLIVPILGVATFTHQFHRVMARA